MPGGGVLTHAQIGAMMGLHPRTIYLIERKAMRKLREALTEDPYFRAVARELGLNGGDQ